MFGVGSVSKMFAAIAVMKFAERGVVDLDDPLVRYLPSFSISSDGWQQITPHMRVSHSTGFAGTDYRATARLCPPSPAGSIR